MVPVLSTCNIEEKYEINRLTWGPPSSTMEAKLKPMLTPNARLILHSRRNSHLTIGGILLKPSGLNDAQSLDESDDDSSYSIGSESGDDENFCVSTSDREEGSFLNGI